MNDEQIKHMANRFLGWPVPEDFNPDAGMSFVRIPKHGGGFYPMPVGTNLLDATQAEAMVRYLVEGLPVPGEVAVFKEQSTGARVATILDNENEALEVMRCADGKYDLIIHNRRGETDRWEDLTVTLKPAHFAALGTIATEST